MKSMKRLIGSFTIAVLGGVGLAFASSSHYAPCPCAKKVQCSLSQSNIKGTNLVSRLPWCQYSAEKKDLKQKQDCHDIVITLIHQFNVNGAKCDYLPFQHKYQILISRFRG